uniref:Uncharacterized protein n=1 Tax=Geoglobus ahangari TaxID=113653 RepID=A0A7C4S5E9_9EURY
MATSYYEKFTAPFKYEMIIVGSRKPFIAETTYGKVVGVEVDFDAGDVEARIKEENLPEEIVKILYHGI